MKERPILFSAPMVRAILEGRKTQTRRLVKSRHVLNGGDPGDANVLSRLEREYGKPIKSSEYGVSFDADGVRACVSVPMTCPYGVPGDRLWVREAWQPLWATDKQPSSLESPEGWAIGYPATDGVKEWRDEVRERLTTACKPSIHMPRWASRIELDVTGVRVERLHAITDADAKAEGATPYIYGHGFITEFGISADPGIRTPSMYRAGFEQIWREINGCESWDTNPFAWVVEFKRVERAA